LVDPSTFTLWAVLGIIVGWLTGQYLSGYRLVDDLIGGTFAAIMGGTVAYGLFGSALGGLLGSAVFGIALAASLVFAIRLLPRPNFF